MKDPAFLFYPNDYLGGTMGMTFEEKGAYMELLMLQFNRGHMTPHMIGQTVGQLWDKVKDKFVKDKDGLWYNQRLEEEKIKRQNFTKSRRNNLKGKNQYSDTPKKEEGHTTSRMENRNRNENKNGDLAETNIKILKGEIYLENICMKKSLDMESVLDILNTFIIDQDLCDGLYRPIEEIKSHFINTLNHRLKDKPKVRTYQEWLKDNGLEDSELNQERHKKHREIWDEHKRKNRVST